MVRTIEKNWFNKDSESPEHIPPPRAPPNKKGPAEMHDTWVVLFIICWANFEIRTMNAHSHLYLSL